VLGPLHLDGAVAAPGGGEKIRSRAADGNKNMTTPEAPRPLRKSPAVIILAAVVLVLVAVALIALVAAGGGDGGSLIEY
jgi:hypothetical protein